MQVLIVDDEQGQRELLVSTVRAWGHEVESAVDGVQAVEKLASFPASIIVTDLKMPRMDGFELLRTLRQEGSQATTIVLTAFGSIETAVSTIHDLGALWFLEKPVNLSALAVLLERAAAQSRLAGENDQLRRELSYRGVLCDLVGASKPMQEIFSQIRQVAPTNAAVLITGESGTGKELAARAIHTMSSRQAGPFIAINCAALPATLMESELFGHEKGSFTGAVDRRVGCMEMAHKGTLFLDELAEMPVQMQAKLLRALEEFRFRRLGGKQELDVDVRVIAATNRPPVEAIEEGNLREDLYYRLNVFHLQMPALRDHKEDIPVLVESMIHTMNRKHGTHVSRVSPSVLDFLTTREWEGNVRELRNVIEHAVILAGKGEITRSHLPSEDHGLKANRQRAKEGDSELGVVVGSTVAEAERALIEATLKHAGNNKTRASMMLGISVKTLHTKLKQYEGTRNGS